MSMVSAHLTDSGHCQFASVCGCLQRESVGSVIVTIVSASSFRQRMPTTADHILVWCWHPAYGDDDGNDNNNNNKMITILLVFM